MKICDECDKPIKLIGFSGKWKRPHHARCIRKAMRPIKRFRLIRWYMGIRIPDDIKHGFIK